MVIKITKYLFSLIAFVSTLAFGQALTPFDQWVRERPEWKKDPSEIAYVAARCSSLELIVGKYISQEGNKPRDIELGKAFIHAGNVYGLVSIKLGDQLGMSNTFVKERHLSLGKFYSNQVAENKKLHNQVIYGDLEKDFNFCADQFQLFNALNTELGSQGQASSKGK